MINSLGLKHRWDKSSGGEIQELKDDYASIRWLERLQLSKSYHCGDLLLGFLRCADELRPKQC